MHTSVYIKLTLNDFYDILGIGTICSINRDNIRRQIMSIDYNAVIENARGVQEKIEREEKARQRQETEEVIRRAEDEAHEEIEQNIQEISRNSLEELSNNRGYYVDPFREVIVRVYEPYLLDLGTILTRLRLDLEVDHTTVSQQIKIDLAEQLSKVYELPDLEMECFIACPDYWIQMKRKNAGLLKRISSWIFKSKDKFPSKFKYKIVFTGRKATYKELTTTLGVS